MAASIRTFDDRFVVLVGAVVAKADERKVPRGAQLPSRLLANPAFEQLREPNAVADARLQAFAPVAAEDRPELERAETPSERRPVVGEVVDLLARAEKLGHDAERAAEVVGAARPEERAIHGREEPLVRVDDERVGPLDTGL